MQQAAAEHRSEIKCYKTLQMFSTNNQAGMQQVAATHKSNNNTAATRRSNYNKSKCSAEIITITRVHLEEQTSYEVSHGTMISSVFTVN